MADLPSASASGRLDGANRESVLQAPDGRLVELKVHRGLWSDDYPENSLQAFAECYRERVARTELDFNLLRDADFLVIHDGTLADSTTGTGTVDQTTRDEARSLRLLQHGSPTSYRPALLSEVLSMMAAAPFPTLMELDVKDIAPWPWERVEELVRLVEPVRDRIIFGGCADWNLRRLLEVDAALPVGFTPTYYLDWVPPGETPDPWPAHVGAYGYLDVHPLSSARLVPTPDYLRERFESLVLQVPGMREMHLSLVFQERMQDDGFDAVSFLHALGIQVDVWTLDAGAPRWQERLRRAVEAGADVVTTNTPRAMRL